MTDKLTIKLMSLVIHYEEFISTGGHLTDRQAIIGLLNDPEILALHEEMSTEGLIPVTRDGASWPPSLEG